MAEKKDDFLTWGILGAVGAAVVGLVLGGLNKNNSNQPVNSYQSTNSYIPPPPPSDGGCGCGA